MAKEAVISSEPENNDEVEQITIARALRDYCLRETVAMANSADGSLPFHKKFPAQIPRTTSSQTMPMTTSKILPLICPKAVPHNNRPSPSLTSDNLVATPKPPALETHGSVARSRKFPAPGAAPYVPIRQMRANCRGMAPPVTIRTAVPVFSAPSRPPPPSRMPTPVQASHVQIAPPVCLGQVVPVFAAPPTWKDLSPVQEKARTVPCLSLLSQPISNADNGTEAMENLQESEAAKMLDQLKM